MKFLSLIYSFFFGCFHTRTSWPLTIDGETHVACLQCGERIPYDWGRMKRKR